MANSEPLTDSDRVSEIERRIEELEKLFGDSMDEDREESDE